MKSDAHMSGREFAAWLVAAGVTAVGALVTMLDFAISNEVLLIPIALLSGPLAAGYSLAISLLARDRMRGVPAAVLALLGLTHVFWLGMCASLGARVGSITPLIAVTGIVFACAAGATTRMLFPFAIIGIATLVAVAFAIWGSTSAFVLSATALHVGIAFGMAAYVRKSYLDSARQARLANRCERCGYSLTGLTTRVCPECGERCQEPTTNL